MAALVASNVNTYHRKKRTRKIENQALSALMQITGAPKTDLLTCLYRARIIDEEEPIYDRILTYVENSQNHGFKIKVLSIIRLVRKNDKEFEYDDTARNRFRMMLFHGTSDSSILPILKNGFIQPTLKNQMFGTGIYFADRASKSAQYCGGNKPGVPPTDNSFGHLFLCDVLLGEMYTAKNPHHEYTTPPVKQKRNGVVQCDSARCVGASIPDPGFRLEERKRYEAIWPMGKTIRNTKFKDYSVRFNEYVVYSNDQIKAKYLIKVQFNL